jgi:hypothetical protein
MKITWICLMDELFEMMKTGFMGMLRESDSEVKRSYVALDEFIFEFLLKWIMHWYKYIELLMVFPTII